MSQSLRDTIAKGESLAEAALRKVFEFGANMAPENDGLPELEVSSRGTKADIPPPARPASSSHETTKAATMPSSSLPKRPFKAEEFASDGKRHLLLACSGSVATIKLPNMLRALSAHSAMLSIRVVLTSSAVRFLQGQAGEQPTVASLGEIPGVDGIYFDDDEWAPSWTRGAPILHIELRRWADALFIAPLSANTLAKMVAGLCDNLLTSVVRAWDTESVMGFVSISGAWETAAGAMEAEVQEGRSEEPLPSSSTQNMQSSAEGGEAGGSEKKTNGLKKVIMVAPAMNTAMWTHPITARQIKVLQEEWHWTRVLLPMDEKLLACGDVGTGAMKEWSAIVEDIEEVLELGQTGAEMEVETEAETETSISVAATV